MHYFTPRTFVPLVLQCLAWPFARTVFALLFHMRVEGLERVPLDGRPLIFAPTHGSEFDPIAVRAALPFLWKGLPMFYVLGPISMYKDSVFGWRRYIYGEWFFWAWGAYATRSGHKDYSIALAEHEQLLKAGHSICIFPGGRTFRKDGERPEKIHGGIGYLALTSAAHVVPVRVWGLNGHTAAQLFSGTTHAKVEFLTPICFDEAHYKQESLNRCKDVSSEVINALYAQN